MAQSSYPIKGVSRRYWSDADRMVMVANLITTAVLMAHDIADRQGLGYLREETIPLEKWADEFMRIARLIDSTVSPGD